MGRIHSETRSSAAKQTIEPQRLPRDSLLPPGIVEGAWKVITRQPRCPSPLAVEGSPRRTPAEPLRLEVQPPRTSSFRDGKRDRSLTEDSLEMRLSRGEEGD
jgi:hypothetical protein